MYHEFAKDSGRCILLDSKIWNMLPFFYEWYKQILFLEYLSWVKCYVIQIIFNFILALELHFSEEKKILPFSKTRDNTHL